MIANMQKMSYYILISSWLDQISGAVMHIWTSGVRQCESGYLKFRIRIHPLFSPRIWIWILVFQLQTLPNISEFGFAHHWSELNDPFYPGAVWCWSHNYVFVSFTHSQYNLLKELCYNCVMFTSFSGVLVHSGNLQDKNKVWPDTV